MNILNKPIKEITFNDVQNFCKEGYTEGIQLDYKRDLPPKGLAKHFASFSNTRGGLIIIGVEEDPKKGIPRKWEGISNEGKIEERVHQWASSVQPIPIYQVQTTNEVNGKVFVLLRIFEGNNPPYYQANGAFLWVRTGNISNPIDIASPDFSEILFRKKDKAESTRKQNLKNMEFFYENALKPKLKNYLEELNNKGNTISEEQLIKNSSMCKTVIQPIFPAKPLASRKIIGELCQSIAIESRATGYPSTNLDSMPYGLHTTNILYGDRISSEQVFLNGLLSNIEDIARIREDGTRNIYIGTIVGQIYGVLLAAEKFYRNVGYQGALCGLARVENIEGAAVHPIVPRQFIYHGDVKYAFLPHYEWPIELDTNVLSNEASFKIYLKELIGEIYAHFDYESPSDAVIEAFFKD